jgi:hypothetical protein
VSSKGAFYTLLWRAAVADTSTRGVDPVLRLFAKSSVRRALMHAALETRSVDARTIAKIATLRQHGGALSFDPDDDASIDAAFSQLAKPAPMRPYVTLAALVLVVAAPVLAVFVQHKLRAFDPTRDPLGQVFGPDLTDYIVDVSRNPKASPSRSSIMDHAARGGFAGDALGALLDQTEHAAQGSATEADLMISARSLDQKLRSEQRPYYVDGRLYRERSPVIYSFYIEREKLAIADGFAPERTVFLWRLDTLNISKSVLGYTHRFAESGLVLFDQIEETLIAEFLPALAEGETLDLLDDKSRNAKEPWQRDAEERSARITRETFAAGTEAKELAALKELGTLLAKRRQILKRWQTDLGQQSLTLRPPKRLLPERDYAQDLWVRVSRDSRHEWDAVHDTLRETKTLKTFEGLRDRFAEGTARHEVQHRLDAQKAPPCPTSGACATLRVPETVRKFAGGIPGEYAPGGLGARVSDETSAYLAEMADAPISPKLTLVSLSHFLFNREAWGDTYCYAALAILEALSDAKALGDPESPMVYGGQVQRRHVASLLAILYALPDEALRSSAKAAWEKLFERTLPHVTYREEHQNEKWRH